MNQELKHIVIKPAQIITTLQISRGTLRNYLIYFGELLSESATKPTGKIFSLQDLNTLRQAYDLINREGLSYQETKQKLLSTSASVLEPEFVTDPRPGQAAADPGQDQQTQIAPLEFFNNLIQQLTQDHEKTLNAKEDLINELRKDKEKLQEEVFYLRLPWYKKIFFRYSK